MFARALPVSFALVLAACGPSSQPEAKSDAASPGNEVPVASELLANEALAGTWEAVGDGATTGVRFTSKSYPDTLTVGCDGGTRRAFINWTVSDPTQNGEMRVYTEAKTVVFAATATNDGTHMLGVDVDGTDPRLGVLKLPQKRFAVQGFGQAIVVPWEPSVAAALNECAG